MFFNQDRLNNIKTPCFIVNEAMLEVQLNEINNAISKYWNNTKIAYSVKTNSLPWVLAYFLAHNHSLEVVSAFEYEWAKLSGAQSENIICNGPIKSAQWLEEAYSNHSLVHLDSWNEIESTLDYVNRTEKNIEVGLRVYVTEENFPVQSQAGSHGSRFGFSYTNGELEKAIGRLTASPHIKIASLHFHCGTVHREVAGYRWIIQQFGHIVTSLHLNDIQILDIGGSFGHDFDNKINSSCWPTWEQYFEGISDELYNLKFIPKELQLIIEPGVSIVGGAVDYYTKITGKKHFLNGYIYTCDGSRNHVDPHYNAMKIVANSISDNDSTEKKEETAGGFTCIEADRIMLRGNAADFKTGSIFCVSKKGAYAFALSPNFINGLPPIYLIDKEGTIKCIQPEITAKKLFDLYNGQMQII